MARGPLARRARCAALALGAFSLMLATACGSPKYHYVKSSSDHTYVKVPQAWALFDEKQIGTALEESPEYKDRVEKLTWSVGFDAAPEPSLENVLSPTAGHPTGLVQVRTLLEKERDQFSLATLRSFLLDFDPLEAGRAGVEVLASRNVDRPGGLHGSEFVVNLKTREGTRVKWRQIALVDSGVHKIHVLAITCMDDCYRANEKVIDKVVASWQVKER